MNIGNLVTQDNANEGVWFQAVLYGKKQPFDIKIIGADSDTVQQYQREQLRKVKSTMKGGKDINDIDDDTFEELMDSSDDNIINRINGLRTHGKVDEPLTLDDVTLRNDKESYALLIEKIPAIKEFVLKKSNERLNFLSVGKKN